MEVNKEKYYKVIAKRIMKAIECSARTGKDKGYNFGRTEEIPIDITFEQILERVKKTKGKCERTGIPFPLVNNDKDYTYTNAKRLGFNPLIVPSADRIDSNGIYTMDNLQIVIQLYNLGKGSKTQKEMDEAMLFIQTPPKESIIYENINVKNTNQLTLNKNKMNTTKQPALELIKTLIDNNASDYALKFYIETQFDNKVEAKITKVETNSKEKSYGKPYVKRETYLDDNTIEVLEFEPNHLLLTDILNVKDRHAMLCNKRFDKVMKHNIKLVRKPSERGAGWIYGIDMNDAQKLK